MIEEIYHTNGLRIRRRRKRDRIENIMREKQQAELFGAYVASSDDTPKEKPHKENN